MVATLVFNFPYSATVNLAKALLLAVLLTAAVYVTVLTAVAVTPFAAGCCAVLFPFVGKLLLGWLIIVPTAKLLAWLNHL